MSYNFDEFNTGNFIEFPYNVEAILRDLNLEYTRDEEWLNFCCPLHDDKTPSAGIWGKYGIFRCFVCGNFSFRRLLVQWLDISYDDVNNLLKKYDKNLNLKIDGNDLQSALDHAILSKVAYEDTDLLFSRWIRTTGLLQLGFEECDELCQEYDSLYNSSNFIEADEFAHQVMLAI